MLSDQDLNILCILKFPVCLSVCLPSSVLELFDAESQEPVRSSGLVYCVNPGTRPQFWCGLLRKARNPSTAMRPIKSVRMIAQER